MAWIESHSDLGEHPKLAELCFNLTIKKHEAIGHLHLLWHFAIKYAWRSGNLEKFSPRIICQAVGWDKDENTFISALQRTGWLDLDSLQLHDWMDYAGKLVRDRVYQENRRLTAINGDLIRETPVTLPNITLPNQKIKDIRSKSKPKTGVPVWEPDLFARFWQAYPRKVAGGAAKKAWNRLKPDQALVDKMLQTLSISRVKLGWDASEPHFIPHPATWLNSERFNDILDVPAKPVIQHVPRKIDPDLVPIPFGLLSNALKLKTLQFKQQGEKEDAGKQKNGNE